MRQTSACLAALPFARALAGSAAFTTSCFDAVVLVICRGYSCSMFGQLLKRLIDRNAAPAVLPAQLLAQSRDCLAQSRHAEAIRTLDTLLARAPDFEEALFLRGTAYVDSGRPSEALADLARAAALAPADPRYPYNLAVAHWMLNDTDQTVRYCRQALESENDFRPAHMLLANACLPGEPYLSLMGRIHLHLKPRTYVETGVFKGESIKLAQPATIALGVDPQPLLPFEPPPHMRIFAQTSDDFFARPDLSAQLQGMPLDLGFIDGMHHFDFALRDFINMERLCAPASTIFVHDCFPLDRFTAARERTTDFWSGDIWRLILLLKKYRPDLSVNVIATPMTGLGVIRNPDPSSRFLADNLESVCAEFMAVSYSVLDEDKAGTLNLFPNDWEKIKALLDVIPAE
jgi:hypothetical protein